MMSGTVCPACEGRLAARGDGWYECDDCGEAYEVTDMFLP